MTKLGTVRTDVAKELEWLNDLLDEAEKMDCQLRKLKRSLIIVLDSLEKKWVKLSNFSKSSERSKETNISVG